MTKILIFLAFVACLTGCAGIGVHEIDAPTADLLHQIIIPQIGLQEPLPLPTLVDFLQQVCDASYDAHPKVVFLVADSATKCTVTNDWPTVCGRRHTAYDFLVMIAASARVSVALETNTVRIWKP